LKMSLLSYSEDIKEGKCQSIPKPSWGIRIEHRL
jgi:hypothetical protein